MALFTLVIGSVFLFLAAFAAWYTVWHRRVESCFERVPVETGRAVHVLRKGVSLGGDAR
ncbi:MAG TPA: hypothetical protein VG346_05220 [Acidimicrobiales bacterium]|nr:hypothetical protein [Acidimicrobiales bacterium]